MWAPMLHTTRQPVLKPSKFLAILQTCLPHSAGYPLPPDGAAGQMDCAGAVGARHPAQPRGKLRACLNRPVCCLPVLLQTVLQAGSTRSFLITTGPYVACH